MAAAAKKAAARTAPAGVVDVQELQQGTVTLPAPPEGYSYVLVAGTGVCPAQTCPLNIDDPLAYAQP